MTYSILTRREPKMANYTTRSILDKQGPAQAANIWPLDPFLPAVDVGFALQKCLRLYNMFGQTFVHLVDGAGPASIRTALILIQMFVFVYIPGAQTQSGERGP